MSVAKTIKAGRSAAERELQAVSLREVARQAGVSHAAPYHHFADKAALVAAVEPQAQLIVQLMFEGLRPR